MQSMIYTRPYDEIYPSWHLNPLSIEEANRMARREILEADSSDQIIRWLYEIPSPHDREVVAICLYKQWAELVKKRQEPAVWFDFDGNMYLCWSDYETDIRRILRDAHDEEIENAPSTSSETTPSTNLGTAAETEVKPQTTVVYNIYPKELNVIGTMNVAQIN